MRTCFKLHPEVYKHKILNKYNIIIKKTYVRNLKSVNKYRLFYLKFNYCELCITIH